MELTNQRKLISWISGDGSVTLVSFRNKPELHIVLKNDIAFLIALTTTVCSEQIYYLLNANKLLGWRKRTLNWFSLLTVHAEINVAAIQFALAASFPNKWLQIPWKYVQVKLCSIELWN